MNRIYSSTFRIDLLETVQSAIASKGIVNFSVVAEEIRKRNEAENIALEDVEQLVLEVATDLRAAVEFDGAEMDADRYLPVRRSHEQEEEYALPRNCLS